MNRKKVNKKNLFLKFYLSLIAFSSISNLSFPTFPIHFEDFIKFLLLNIFFNILEISFEYLLVFLS